MFESYDDESDLSDVQMTVNSYIGITYDDESDLGNASELRVQRSLKKQ